MFGRPSVRQIVAEHADEDRRDFEKINRTLTDGERRTDERHEANLAAVAENRRAIEMVDATLTDLNKTLAVFNEMKPELKVTLAEREQRRGRWQFLGVAGTFVVGLVTIVEAVGHWDAVSAFLRSHL